MLGVGPFLLAKFIMAKYYNFVSKLGKVVICVHIINGKPYLLLGLRIF